MQAGRYKVLLLVYDKNEDIVNSGFVIQAQLT